MKVINKKTGEDVSEKFFEDLKRVTEGKKAIHFPASEEEEKANRERLVIFSSKEDVCADAFTPAKIQIVKMINNRLEALGDWFAGLISEKEYQDICWRNRFEKIPHPRPTTSSVNGGKKDYHFSQAPELAKKEKEVLEFWRDTLAYAARNWHFCS